MSVPRLSVRHPVTTTMVFAALALLGGISAARVGQELFPDVNLPTMVIITVSPGTSPVEMESQVTVRIEEAVAGVNGVEDISSWSLDSVSQVVVAFTENEDLGRAQVNVREAITGLETSFPDGTGRPRIFMFSASQTPSLELNVVSESAGVDLRRLAERTIRPALERVAGVGQVSVFGGREEAVMVGLALDALNRTGVPVTQVLQAFGGENVTLPAGSVTADDRNVSLRTIGEFTSPEDVGSVLVGYQGTVPVFLRDLASVEIGYRPQTQFARALGRDALRIVVRKQPDANTVDVNDGVLAAIDRLSATFPPGIRVEVQENQADMVRQSIGGVIEAGWQGGLLAIVILLFFLRNLRSTAIVAAVIPVAVIATMSLIDFGNMTLNIVSLMGITLAIGMFVDNSIVVLESIYRKALAGLPPAEAAIEGAEEVSKAVAASTLTSMAVFLPMLFLGGLAGALFNDLSLTIAFSLFMSLAASLSLTPVMCARFLRVTPAAANPTACRTAGSAGDVFVANVPTACRTAGSAGDVLIAEHHISLADVVVATRSPALNRVGAVIGRALTAMDSGYERLVAGALRHKGFVIGAAVVLLAVSVGSVLLLGTEFLPEADEGSFTVRFSAPEGVATEVTLEKAGHIEQIVREIAGADLVALATVAGGGGGFGGEVSASHDGAVYVALTPVDRRSRDIWEITRLVDRRVAAEVIDVDHRVQVVGLSSLAGMATGNNSPIVIELTGDDRDRMADHASLVVRSLSGIPGTRNIRSSASAGVPERQFVVRRGEAATLGLSAREVAVAVRAAFNGADVSTFRYEGRDLDVVVILGDDDRDPDRIGSLFLVNPAGNRIPLENVIEERISRGPVAIERSGRTRVVRVLGDLDGTVVLGDAVAQIGRRLAELGPPPPGIELSIEGSSQEMGTSFRNLAVALAIAVALVYMVMASQFENLVNPLIVMGSVPFAVIGLVGALLLTNTTFSIIAFAGGILLVGLVVNNAIVLIDYMDTLRRRGVELTEAIVAAGRTRLKPILMTTLTTLLGLLPMSFGRGSGAELRYPIGRAVIGGLLTSTLITLVLIPVLYALVEGTIRPAIARRRAAREAYGAADATRQAAEEAV